MSDKEESQKNSGNTIIRFAGVAIQMGVIIGAGAWGGSELDDYLKFEKPVFAIVFSLLGISIALYLVIREALRIK